MLSCMHSVIIIIIQILLLILGELRFPDDEGRIEYRGFEGQGREPIDLIAPGASTLSSLMH